MKLKIVRALIFASLAVMLFVAVDSNAQNPFFPKPDLLLTHIKTPIEIHPGEEIGGRVEVTWQNNGIAPVEGGYTLTFYISTDRKLREIVPGPVDTYIEDVVLEGGYSGEMPGLEIEETYFYTHPRLRIMDNIPFGSYQICAFIDPDDIIEEEDGRRNFLCAPIHIIPDTSQSSGPVVDPTPTPPTQVVTRNRNLSLESYDDNGNCLLEDSEFFNVTDDWTSNIASERTFFAAIDAWMSQRNICSSVNASGANIIEKRGAGIVFSAVVQDPLEIVVYDISGREVFSRTSLTGVLYWNLKTAAGDIVPNGVYFARFGNSEVRKFMVMR